PQHEDGRNVTKIVYQQYPSILLLFRRSFGILLTYTEKLSMAKDDEPKLEVVASNEKTPDGKEAVLSDNLLEHQQTVRQVISQHPALVWWAFFFSVSAIGW